MPQLRHSPRHASFMETGTAAMRRYVAEVAEGRFPDEGHVRHMAPAEAERLNELLGERSGL